MKIDFVRGMSDAKRWFRHTDLCVRNRMGQNVATSSPATPDRKSPDQLAFRQAVKEAAQAWSALDTASRQTWHAYARRHGHLLSDQLYKDLSGWEVYLPAFLSRTLLNAAPPPPQPSPLPPPEAVTAIEEVPATEDDTFSFRLTHALPPEGHALIVRITPSTVTRARRPYPRTARLIRGHTPDSVVPLPASGSTVTFQNARFPIAPAQRFGVAVRIMRLEDGVTGPEFFADLLRAEPPTDQPTPPEPPPLETKGTPRVTNRTPVLTDRTNPDSFLRADAPSLKCWCEHSAAASIGATPLAHLNWLLEGISRHGTGAATCDTLEKSGSGRSRPRNSGPRLKTWNGDVVITPEGASRAATKSWSAHGWRRSTPHCMESA